MQKPNLEGQKDEIHAIATVRFLTAAEGGRRGPVHSGYRGQLFYDDHDWDALWIFDREVVTLGETAEVMLRFLSPWAHSRRVIVGLKFAVREGNKTVGQGVITWVDEEL